jgi:uncharacterized protein YodC (DUF2158 family)
MAAKFQIGDVVRLKSGGPEMTVSHITLKGSTQAFGPEKHEYTSYTCQWFAGSKAQHRSFREEILEPVKNADEP